MGRYVAVDSHRTSWFVVIEAPDGTELMARRFPVSVAGERELMAQLEPGDQVHIGQTRRSRVAHVLPPWMQALGRLGEPQ